MSFVVSSVYKLFTVPLIPAVCPSTNAANVHIHSKWSITSHNAWKDAGLQDRNNTFIFWNRLNHSREYIWEGSVKANEGGGYHHVYIHTTVSWSVGTNT